MNRILSFAEGLVTAYLLAGAWLVIICESADWPWQFKLQVITAWPWMLYVIAQAVNRP